MCGPAEDVLCLVVAQRLLRPGAEEDVMLTVTGTAVKEKELDAGRTVAEVSDSGGGGGEGGGDL